MPGSPCNCRCWLLAGVLILDGLRGPQVGADEPGRRPAVDSLARPADPGLAGGGQRLLHGVSVHAAPDPGPPLAADGPQLAALAAEQMAGGGPARRCSSGLTRRSACGTARGGRRGSRWATSSLAFVIDGFFRGAAFCKYVCPIGQFNFVQSLVSPLEVKVRDPEVCASCRTKDCIRGRDGIPGCELHLFQPRKAGNMDCTFCLDCVHACPHDNIGILAGPPGSDLWHDALRSGVGPLRQTPRPGGPRRGPGVRRLRQRRGHGRPGAGVARPAGLPAWGSPRRSW